MKKLLSSAVLGVLAVSAFAKFDSPEAAIAALRDSAAAGKLPQFSQFLPVSYQNDLVDIVHDFAGRMDPDLWNAGRILLKTAGDSLAPKAGLLVEFTQESGEATDIDKAKLEKSLGAFLQGVSAFASENGTTLNALKTISFDSLEKTLFALFPQDALDIGYAFIADNNGAKGDMPRDELVKKLAVASSKKLDNGDVSVTFAEDDEPVTFRQIDGCWLPTELADSWTEFVNDARTSISSIDFSSVEGQQAKMQVLMILPAVQSMVQPLGTANTADEFKSKFEAMVGVFFGGGLGF